MLGRGQRGREERTRQGHHREGGWSGSHEERWKWHWKRGGEGGRGGGGGVTRKKRRRGRKGSVGGGGQGKEKNEEKKEVREWKEEEEEERVKASGSRVFGRAVKEDGDMKEKRDKKVSKK